HSHVTLIVHNTVSSPPRASPAPAASRATPRHATTRHATPRIATRATLATLAPTARSPQPAPRIMHTDYT
ncbi:hypothetical protein KGM_215441B, partial [Danaus plexippus plexippus]